MLGRKSKGQSSSIPNELTAEKLNSFYVGIGPSLSDRLPIRDPVWLGPDSIYSFQFENITVESVFNELKKCKSASSLDVLDMDSKLIRCAAGKFAFNLCHIINMSISHSLVVPDWKKARVCPIYKGKGSKTEEKNYRPISVLSHISKVVEKCVFYACYLLYVYIVEIIL